VPKLDPDLASLQEVRDALARAKAAAEAVREYSQADIDRVCAAMAQAVSDSAAELARLAVEETGIGRVHYKILKNIFGSEGTWASIKDEQTVGIIKRDTARGLMEVATPSGVIAGIVPTTNPTSTAVFKALISVKGRNSIVLSPHPRAIRCIAATVEVMRKAIQRCGAPPDLVVSLMHPTLESTGALMKSKHTAIILATGGEGLVHAAYSSGRPAYGVGPGNVPVYVDRSADPAAVAKAIVASQSFDNGTFCCSEQAIVADRPIHDALMRELERRGAYMCDERETALLAAHCNKGGMMNADVVGQDPWKIARGAGFQVPENTTVLLARQGGVGREWPLTIEILCPVLSVHVVNGWREGCDVCMQTLKFGGLGHTLGVHANDQAVLDAFFMEKPASRIIANGPTSQGAVGYSTNLDPSVSLGCGPQAGNISSDNITARHLLNIKRVAFPRQDWAESEVADHARAAALGGDRAPRGSGLPGDPGLRAGASASPASSSAWQGNPAVRPMEFRSPARSAQLAPAPKPQPQRDSGQRLVPAAQPSSPQPQARPATPAMQPKVGPGTKSAPVFTRASGSATDRLRPATASRPQPSPDRPRPTATAPLSTKDIQNILTHAGSGCPLGPCQGCPHQEVTTGACTA
jgi:acetaldehyde dehydrogenase (acetylating)